MKYNFVDLTGRIGKNNEKCFAFSREDRAVFKGFCCQEIWWDIETLKLKYEQSTEHQYCTYLEFLNLIPKGFFNDEEEPEQTILDRVCGSFSGIVDVIDEGKGIELYEALIKGHKEIAEQVQSNEALLLRSELAAQRLISTFKLYFQAVKKDKITYVKDGKVHQACLEGDAIAYTVTDLTF